MHRSILNPELAPKWVDISNEEYHADKTTVSSSALKTLIKSPKAFKCYQFDGVRKKETKSLRLGRLAHLAILEWQKFEALYQVMPDFGPMQSSKNRAIRDAWIAEVKAENPDAVICTQEDRDDILGMMESIASHPDASALLREGIPEISGYYADPETGIACRIRPDFFSKDLTVLTDLKTTSNVERWFFSKQIWEYGYYLSLAMYAFGASVINRGIKVEHQVFIAVEPKKPYEVAVYPSCDATMEYGLKRYRRLMDELLEHINAGHFPAYQARMENISLPHFVWGIEP